MANTELLNKLRAEAGELIATLRNVDDEITSDAGAGVATGYAEYANANVKDSIDNADALLKRDYYKLCFAGGFSGGKSTAINALLGEPDLLPVAAGECTMSITVVSAPGPGENERVVVDYFTKEMAVINVVHHQKAYKAAFEYFADELAGASVDEMMKTIGKVAKWLPTVAGDDTLDESLREEYEPQNAARRAFELDEFLMYVSKYGDRLGGSYTDQADNAHVYLALDSKDEGLGHLMLVEKVHVFKNNRLFVENGIMIIDLPGTDSPNQRQKELTLNFLNEADLVFSVLEPKGFKFADMEIIATMSQANLGNIRNKMFFIINKFDTMTPGDFHKEELEKLLQTQIHGEIVRNKINPKHIYPACAILDVLESAGKTDDYKAALEGCKSKLSNMCSDTMEPWNSRVTDALEGRGISKMRDAVIEYLENELAFERVKDIMVSLAAPVAAANALLAADAPAIAAAKTNRTSAIGDIRDFIEKAHAALEVNLVKLNSNLPNIIKTNVMENAVKPKILEAIGRVKQIPLADQAKQVSFAGQTAVSQTPNDIKQLWINFTKKNISDQFVSTVEQILVGPIQGMVDKQVEESKLGIILAQIDEASDDNLSASLKQAIERGKQNIGVITQLRSDEETWMLRERDVRPQGFDPAWTPQIEESFKSDLVTNYSKAFIAYCDKLADVLPRYYAVIVQNVINDCKAGADEMETVLKNTESLDLPTHLVSGEAPDPEEARKRRLLVYENMISTATEQNDSIKTQLP